MSFILALVDDNDDDDDDTSSSDISDSTIIGITSLFSATILITLMNNSPAE